ncbi:MAG TPA: sugar kinase [Sphingomonas sp.]
MRIVSVGESMLELATGGDGAWRLGYGGDTVNTAVHLARYGNAVAYATALGEDAFSAELKEAWVDEGLDVSLVLTDPDRVPGLYAIRTDPAGERSFTYWRDNSAARRFFALPQAAAVMRQAEDADLLYLSLISLAILPDEGRGALLEVARRCRARGGRVAFDGNYRPRLWRNRAEASRWRDAAIACATIGLPTADDEAALSGSGDAAAIEAHWRGLGAEEVVVKLGAKGCLLTGGAIVAPAQRLQPRDTTGAGDAFNAGYLHARLAGEDVHEAAAAGHRLAGWVIQRSGAVPPRDSAAPYAG